MRRVNSNFVIDVVALFALLLLVSTGLLLEFRLPPGSGGHEPYGLGRRALDRPITTIWGWTRHEWGEFHFWLACAFVVILVIHLVLHLKWIVAMCKNLTSLLSPAKLFGLIAGVIILLGLTALPLIVPKNGTSLREQQNFQFPAEQRAISDDYPEAVSDGGSIDPVSVRLRWSSKQRLKSCGM